ncbi:SCO5918 family protein [Streptomyces sp. NPDC047869]|uniref:SCO5918 family protein n=1 Tax=Streptomyces sp. NPDC047869 TaxID=3154709 RepID=UPI0034533932
MSTVRPEATMRVRRPAASYDLTKSGVVESMKGVRPEPVTSEFVIIGRRHHPAKQVGQVITRQDRRDFSAGEVLRVMTQLGFTCRTRPATAPAPVAGSYQRASAMLGTPPIGLTS